MAFRFWSTIIAGSLISIWILPFIQLILGLKWILIPVLLIFFLTFLLIGRIFNWYGANLLERLIAEATIWQRASKHHQAEDAYNKAIAFFDSFLLSPRARRKRLANLIAHLVRYYLARTDKNQSSEAFIISYLKSHPEDSEVAENWLGQIKNRATFPKEFQELAYRIGKAQPDRMAIQHILARIYLDLGRCDFTALQTYQRVLQDGDSEAVTHIIVDLAKIFLKEGRADEWALSIYLQAFKKSKDKLHLRNGIAACAFWVAETRDNRHLLDEANKILDGIDKKHLEKMRIGFNPPIVEPLEDKIALRNTMDSSLYEILRRLKGRFFQFIRLSALFIFSRSIDFYQAVRFSQKSKRNFKWLVLAILLMGMMLFLINTVGHLLRPKATAEKGKIMDVVTDPFALQVAAYIKSQHAERYVVHLRKNKVDAYWIETQGKKQTWYQVRVSHFADKQSARAYGESLKAKGLIDDFYVTNYSRP